MRVVLSLRAEQQLDEMHLYIEQQASTERADTYVKRIIAFCDGLATFPRRGRKRDDLLLGLLIAVFERGR